MVNPFIEAMQGIFKMSWNLLTKVKYPGTDMPIALILCGAFVVFFGIKLFLYTSHMSVNTGSIVSSAEGLKRKEK